MYRPRRGAAIYPAAVGPVRERPADPLALVAAMVAAHCRPEHHAHLPDECWRREPLVVLASRWCGDTNGPSLWRWHGQCAAGFDRPRALYWRQTFRLFQGGIACHSSITGSQARGPMTGITITPIACSRW